MVRTTQLVRMVRTARPSSETTPRPPARFRGCTRRGRTNRARRSTGARAPDDGDGVPAWLRVSKDEGGPDDPARMVFARIREQRGFDRDRPQTTATGRRHTNPRQLAAASPPPRVAYRDGHPSAQSTVKRGPMLHSWLCSTPADRAAGPVDDRTTWHALRSRIGPASHHPAPSSRTATHDPGRDALRRRRTAPGRPASPDRSAAPDRSARRRAPGRRSGAASSRPPPTTTASSCAGPRAPGCRSLAPPPCM